MRSAYVQKRTTSTGIRYTGYWYDETETRRSAGTYDTPEEALFRAKDAQKRGSLPEPLPRVTPHQHPILGESFRAYSERYLKTTSDLLVGTKRGYEGNLRNYVWPRWGDVAVGDITKDMVVALLDDLQSEGMSAKTANQVRAAIGTCFKPLLKERALPYSPTHGIDLAMPPAPPYRLVTVDTYKMIARRLPSDGARLFADFLISTGLRFGEATEVRVRDFHPHADMIQITRRAVVAGKKWSSQGRFRVDPGTKAGKNRHRSITLDRTLTKRLERWIKDNGLRTDDLLFAKDLVAPNIRPRTTVVKADESTFTGNDGRVHQHGTRYAYAAGGCRCDSCKVALREYRAGRRMPKGEGQKNTSGHLPNDTWRRVWRKAVEDAGLDWYPRTHDLRHAYATHLASKNVDPIAVMELLGQNNLSTTRIYYHRAEGQDAPAVRAAADFLSTT